MAGLWASQILQQREMNTLTGQLDRLEKGVKNLTSQPIQTVDSSDDSADTPARQSELTGNQEEDLANLETRLASLEETVAEIDTSGDSSSQTSSDTSSTSSSVKEFYVYLGSGSSSSTDWTNIPGAVVTIDTGQYDNIKEVRFEAGLSILSGNAYARLVNKDTGAVFTNSEVTHNTSTPTWKTSSTFGLHTGSVNYMVQLRSSSGDRVDLTGARIKIVVE